MEARTEGGQQFRGNRLGRPAVGPMHRADRARHRKEENLILRTAKIWPLTSFAASDARKTARGAIFSADIALKRSTRYRSASVSAEVGRASWRERGGQQG